MKNISIFNIDFLENELSIKISNKNFELVFAKQKYKCNRSKKRAQKGDNIN